MPDYGMPEGAEYSPPAVIGAGQQENAGGAPPAKRRMNQSCENGFVMAIIGFLVPFLHILTIYFCLRGLRETRVSGERGREFAVAGLIIAALWLVLTVTAIVIIGAMVLAAMGR